MKPNCSIWLLVASSLWLMSATAEETRRAPLTVELHQQSASSSTRPEHQAETETVRPVIKAAETDLNSNKEQDRAKPPSDDFYLRDSGCARPGAEIILYSKQSKFERSTNWYLKSGMTFSHLSSTPLTNMAIKLKIPEQLSQSKSSLSSLFYKSKVDGVYQDAKLDIPICGQDVEREFTDGKIVVMADKGELPLIRLYLKERGIQFIEQQWLEKLAMQLMTFKADRNVDSLFREFESRFPASTIDRNHYYTAAAGPRYFAKQQLHWTNLTDCSHQDFSLLRVGLIDALVDTEHADLKHANIQLGHFAAQEDKSTNHATALSLILIGEDDVASSDSSGLVQGASLYAASVIEETSIGSAATTTAIVRALDWLLVNEVRLINMSFSGSRANHVLRRSILIANKNGALIFAAAGNDKLNQTAAFPAAFENVFAITAIDARSHLYTEANQGDYIDFAAPGVNIWVSHKQGQGEYVSGTSYAVPYALAIGAFYVNRNPSIPRDVLYETLRATSLDLGEQGHDLAYGWGMPTMEQLSCQ